MQLDVLGRRRELGLQVVDVLLHARTHVGVSNGCHRALVLLHLRHHVGRQRHGDAGQLLEGDFLDPPFVLVVGVGVDQRDRQRLDVLRAQRLQLLPQVRLIERPHDLALGAHALVGLDRARQRRHRQRLVVDHPAAEAARHEAARDLQHLAVTLGRDQTAARAGAGQDRVGRNRRAVHHVVDLVRVDPGTLADAGDAVEHANRLVGRRTRHLGGPGLSGGFIDEQQVGEGSAHVDAQSIAHECPC